MASILIIRESSKYLVKSLSDQLKEADHNITESSAEVKELSKVIEKQDAVIVFVDPEIVDNQQAIIYLRDTAVEMDLPIYLLGFPGDIETVKTFFSGQVVQGEFYRPFDVKVIAKEISEYIADAKKVNKKKILVVDDSGMMLRNVKGLLGTKYQVILANSGAMAIKYLSMDRPDLVLLDYEMPIVNGKQVLEIIRAENDFQGIPVIFLTGKNDRETIMDVMQLHPEGYLLKTMKAEDFTQAVDEFFEKRKNI